MSNPPSPKATEDKLEIGNIGIGNISTLATFKISPGGGMNLTRREFVKGSLATLGFLVLSAGWKLTIAVRPVSSLGTKGKAIATTWRRETG